MVGGSLQDLMRRTQARTVQPPPETPTGFSTPRTSSPQPFDVDDDADLQPPSIFDVRPPPSSALISSSGIARLKLFTERALNNTKLEAESKSQVRRIAEITNRDERDILLFTEIFAIKEMLSKSMQDQVKLWEPSELLEKAYTRNIRAILVLPSIQSYSGSVESAVLACLREMKAPGLPPPGDSNESTLLTRIGRQLSLDKSTMKGLLSDSTTDPKVENRNIANVTAAIMQSFGCSFHPTLATYHRMAFIRMHLTDRKHSPHKFWPAIDMELAQLRDAGSQFCLSAMETNLEDDIEKFGDPAKTNCKRGSAVDSGSPDWLQVLNRLAAKVERIEPVARPNKRRRIADLEITSTEFSGSASETTQMSLFNGEEDMSGPREGSES
ncbi:hypothetical protein GGX14DRAFT_383963 [Mycena pura]|uniref:Uncharacterized protein n=1 Tax=Mycena pura TaxID=153505 RepID=A0AAD7E632_9AGAR|nr:hypothetical protein GGX14DRAFT_383963 [Mycena pura]